MRYIFVSHIHEEAPLAEALKGWIERLFSGQVEVFVSSDDESIKAGEKWLSAIERVLSQVDLVVALCSKQSIARPWVTFESGGAWIKGVKVIPVCHSDMKKNELPLPLSVFQGIDIESSSACHAFAKAIAAHLELNIPEPNQLDGMERDIANVQSAVSQENRIPRIALWGSSTTNIDGSKKKLKMLKRFYSSLLKNLERTPYGLNSCGAEPVRRAFFERYCDRIYKQPHGSSTDLNWRIRWYWFAADDRGLNYAPPYFDNVQAGNAVDRNLREMVDSDIIVALAGRTGTREQLQRVFRYHEDPDHWVDLRTKPLILLGWFGGSVHRYIDENRREVQWLLDQYSELCPAEEVAGWDTGTTVDDLAQRLVETFQQILAGREDHIR